MALPDKPKGYAPKKLVARDGDDLAIISALLQDAALTPADLAFDQPRGRFALTANRYIHEERGFFRAKKGWRQRVGLHFDHISTVRQKGFSKQLDALALLSIEVGTATDGDALITLIFAGGITVELKADTIDAYLTDMGDPWEALARPDHTKA